MKLAQDGAVSLVLVDGDDLGIPSRLQPRDEVLADEARRTGDDDTAQGNCRAVLCVVRAQSFVRKKIGRGTLRTIAMITDQNQGQ